MLCSMAYTRVSAKGVTPVDPQVLLRPPLPTRTVDSTRSPSDTRGAAVDHRPSLADCWSEGGHDVGQAVARPGRLHRCLRQADRRVDGPTSRCPHLHQPAGRRRCDGPTPPSSLRRRPPTDGSRGGNAELQRHCPRDQTLGKTDQRSSPMGLSQVLPADVIHRSPILAIRQRSGVELLRVGPFSFRGPRPACGRARRGFPPLGQPTCRPAPGSRSRCASGPGCSVPRNG